MDDNLLRVVTLKPQGTAPGSTAGELISYANVALELERDHNFGSWDGPTVGTLASTLGATAGETGSLVEQLEAILARGQANEQTLRGGLAEREDLAGKRVGLGGPASGTRVTARRVLAAHGMQLADLGRLDNSDLETAAARLARGEIDAMFATIGAPAGEIRRQAACKGA